MTLASGAARSLGVLAATVGGVAAITLGLVALVVPAAPAAVATPTAAPTFDLAVAPDTVGGSLAVTGDRTGSLTLDRLESMAGYQQVGDMFELIIGPASLEGPDGRIVFGRDAEGVTQVDYGGLSFYLDPGDCMLTDGALNADAGLISARVECAEISDIRGGGTISLDGVVAVPANVLSGRSGLPPSGGRLDLGGVPLEIPEARALVDMSIIDLQEVSQIGLTSEDGSTVVVVELDRETGEYAMTLIQVSGESSLGQANGESVTVDPACPLAAESVGRLSPHIIVIRLEFDCDDVPLPGGGTGSVQGTVVIDIVEETLRP